MYLWKTSDLVAQLKAGTVSEKDKMLYVLVTGLGYGIMSDPLFSIGLEYSMLDWVGLVLMILTTTVGTLYAYTKNRNGDDQDFITRYISLSVPIGIRLIVVGVVGAVAIGFIEGGTSDGIESDPKNKTTLLQLIFWTVAVAFYYWFLGKRIEDISKGSDA